MFQENLSFEIVRLRSFEETYFVYIFLQVLNF